MSDNLFGYNSNSNQSLNGITTISDGNGATISNGNAIFIDVNTNTITINNVLTIPLSSVLSISGNLYFPTLSPPLTITPADFNNFYVPGLSGRLTSLESKTSDLSYDSINDLTIITGNTQFGTSLLSISTCDIYSILNIQNYMNLYGYINLPTYSKAITQQILNYISNLSSDAQAQFNNITSNYVLTSTADATYGRLSVANAWTNTNTFNSFLPTSTLTPTSSNQLITKNYGDTTYLTISNASSTYLTIANALSTYGRLASANAWTSTNTFNTNLPTSTLTPTLSTQLITKGFSDSTYLTIANASSTYVSTTTADATYGRLASGNAWTSTNTFNINLPTSTLTPFASNHLITKAFGDSTYGRLASINTWTNTNSFNVYLPTSTLTPTTSTELITKAYGDSTYGGLSSANTWSGINTFTQNIVGNINGNLNNTATTNSFIYNALTTGNITMGGNITTGNIKIGSTTMSGTITIGGLANTTNINGNNISIGVSSSNPLNLVGNININGNISSTGTTTISATTFNGTSTKIALTENEYDNTNYAIPFSNFDTTGISITGSASLFDSTFLSYNPLNAKLTTGNINTSVSAGSNNISGNTTFNDIVTVPTPTNDNNNEVPNTAYLKSNYAPIQSGNPTGTIIMLAGASSPSGYLYCNGASFSPSTYANLFTVIGNSYGGTVSAPLLPDFRGCFLRGYGTYGANANYASTGIGVSQSDQVGSHNHSFGGAANKYYGNQNTFGKIAGTSTYCDTAGTFPAYINANTTGTSPENRPFNYPVYYYIKT